jgi:FKBP-type peptidyl-prolyl cis-trans isomerase FkpA
MTRIGKTLGRTAAALAIASLAGVAVAQAPARPASPPASSAAAPSQAAGMETLPSGVGISHTTVGSGPSPTASDKVKVHYRGTLANGTEFDSSYKRGQPAVFPLGRVVPCWTQGLQKLKVGGKATLTCPPATAYGSKGVPNVIPPDSTLTFEVELLSIEPQ